MRNMLITPPRGHLREGLKFGYVDVPERLTPQVRPFLDSLTAASLDLQREIRKGREIEIKNEDVELELGGVKTKMRVFIPDGTGPFPIALYCHGGGFAIRDVDCFDYIGRYLAKNAPAVVFMPEYVLTPEYVFPMQLTQCFDALNWARDNASRYGGDAARDMVLGDSAGGNLAAAICLMCRDRKIRQPAMQLLIYPLVDCTQSEMRESDRLYGEGFNLDYKHLLSYNEAYASTEVAKEPYASPLLAQDHSNLAECFMISAECDILIDQGMEYLYALNASGVKVDYRIFEGMPHDFLFFAFDESYAAYDLICAHLREMKHR